MVPQVRFIATNFRNPSWMSLGVISRFLTRNSGYRSGVQLDNGQLETMCDPQLVVDVVLNPLIKQHARFSRWQVNASWVSPAPTGLLRSPLDITMCFRLTQLTEFSCGHTAIARQQRVDCNRSNCVSSQAHNPESHDCASRCAQRYLICQDRGG
ncbi:hypothetical protein EDD15DRAFT_1713474 [Pisolithus albus]|nr:hypothetical protein EDD15DRAFT_1713474 [Pisolithus albus]